MDIALLLSRFDPLYGPKIILKAPKSLEAEIVSKVPSLMEIPTQGVFMHIFGELKTANLFFKLISPFARGGYESFLLSLVTDANTNLTLLLANELLAGFAQYIINLEDAYKAFDYEPKDFNANPQKLSEIKGFFSSYFETIKPAIKTLVMAENRYQVLFKAARDAIFIMNRDTGIILDINMEGEKLVEKTRQDIIGIEALKLDLFDEGLVDPNMVKHLIDQPPPIISRIKKSTGTHIYLEVSVNEIQLGDQYFIQYIFHDMTDIQAIENKLTEQVKKTEILNKIISIANQANNLSELLKKIRDSFIDLFDLKACSIYLIDKPHNLARIKVHKGFPSYFILQNSELDIRKIPYDMVFNKGVALINNNFPDFIQKFFEGIEVNSTAIFPLFSKFEIIGSLNMVFNESKSLSPEEMELIIIIGLELGTAIERMQNKEKLRQSEMQKTILFDHIPFSIFRISNEGVILDFKFDKKIAKIVDGIFSSNDIIGKHIDEFLPKEIAGDAKIKLEQTLKEDKSSEMKFTLTLNDNRIIFHSNIIPLGNKEVLVLLHNLTRVW
ncbi:MAG: PAS/PAC domain containing protein [Candidatus Lokiarchaeum sp. GC14_75]|nr:MAG: PAS/PAC domain containing protein [Candidatus Lokiarchaeum sp. GC14_75]